MNDSCKHIYENNYVSADLLHTICTKCKSEFTQDFGDLDDKDWAWVRRWYKGEFYEE